METATEIALFTKLEKFREIGTLHQVYLELKRRAQENISTILNQDSELKDRLVKLATNYSACSYRNGIKMISEEYETEDKLLEIAHCQFYMTREIPNIFNPSETIPDSFALVTLYLYINLKRYLTGADNFIYICFWRSETNRDDRGHVKDIGDAESEINALGPEAVIYYRYLTILYELGITEDSKRILEDLFSRTYGSTSECELLDWKTGKTTGWI